MQYNNCNRSFRSQESYIHTIGRGVKWYRKLAFEFLLGTAFVNAHIVYTAIAQSKVSITKFKEEVLQKILETNEPPETEENSEEKSELHHELENTGKILSCVVCYAQRVEEIGRQNAQNKTPRSTWGCNICKHNFCITCFFVHHQAKRYKIC